LGVMNCRSVASTLFLATIFALATACADEPAQAIQSSSDTDSGRVWMALLQAFEGDVLYVGSDDTFSCFRIVLEPV